MYDASNRKDIRKAEKASRLADVQRLEFLRSVMSTPPGRAWIYDLLSRCSIFASTFRPDAGFAAFLEGGRNVGLQFLNDLMIACPDQYIVMVQEANAKSINQATEKDQAYERHDGNDASPTERSGEGLDRDDNGSGEAADNYGVNAEGYVTH